MEQEIKDQVNELRQLPDTEDKALKLLRIAKAFGLPSTPGCFCKWGNITTYIQQFFEAYDKLNESPNG